MPRKTKATATKPRPTRHLALSSLPRGKMHMPSGIRNPAPTQEKNAITIPATKRGIPTLLSTSISIIAEVDLSIFFLIS
jgi:hypothetical protein